MIAIAFKKDKNGLAKTQNVETSKNEMVIAVNTKALKSIKLWDLQRNSTHPRCKSYSHSFDALI